MRYKIVRDVEKKQRKADGKRGANNAVQVVRSVAGAACLAVYVVCVAVFLLPLLPKRPVSQAGEKAYDGVLEMWNVESFEGGCGSRQTWLTKRAAKFERAHKGTYVHVDTLTPSQAEDKLKRGDKFDIVSFSFGSGTMFADSLTEVDVPRDVGDNFRQSTTFGNRTYAIPYLSGIYCLFARQSELAEDNILSQCLVKKITRKSGKHTYELQPLVYGTGYYNIPLYALALSGGRGSAEQSQLSQYAAYEAFVSHTTAVTLLGTQRDLYRLGKRCEAGKIETLSLLPLGGYTDLVQYVGVSDSANRQTALKFCEYLLSDEAQTSLVDIGMFSVAGGIYSDENYKRCEATLAGCYVPNVFTANVEESRKQALQRLENGK